MVMMVMEGSIFCMVKAEQETIIRAQPILMVEPSSSLNTSSAMFAPPNKDGMQLFCVTLTPLVPILLVSLVKTLSAFPTT